MSGTSGLDGVGSAILGTIRAACVGPHGGQTIGFHLSRTGEVRSSCPPRPNRQLFGRFIWQVVDWSSSDGLITAVVFQPTPVFSESYFTSLVKTAP